MPPVKRLLGGCQSPRGLKGLAWYAIAEKSVATRNCLVRPVPGLGFCAATGSQESQLRPLTWQATQLWQIFVQNVNQMHKPLHIPTAQVVIYTAINELDEASPTVNCLLFNIYFAAVTSLPPDEVRHLLGKEKALALNWFRLVLETSLAQANFFR